MPAAFEHCVSSGGRVRTIKHGKDEYQHVCFSGGKSYAGEVKKRKSKKGK